MRSLTPVSVDIQRYEEEDDNGIGGMGGIGGNGRIGSNGGNGDNAIQSKCKESNVTLYTYWISGSSKSHNLWLLKTMIVLLSLIKLVVNISWENAACKHQTSSLCGMEEWKLHLFLNLNGENTFLSEQLQ